jgi:branched-chain amino acid transport system permease protein
MARVLNSGGLAGFVLAAAVILAAPFVLRSDYMVGVGITVGAMSIAASGLILLVGYAHQLALGQAAFCIVGGYGSALLTVRAGWDPAAAMLASAALSMMVAYLIGRPILHLRGFVLAMGSLAVQLVLIHAAIELLDFTGGSMGLTGVPRFSALGFVFSSDLSYYYLVWAFALLSVAICRNIDRSRIGRALRAISVTEAGAASVGIDIARHKVQMFVLSAGLASIAGSLTAHYLRIMEPQIFSVSYSLNMLIAVIIGGLWSPWGGVVGTAALAGLREGLRVLSLPLVELLIVGVVTVVVLMLMPRGLMGLLVRPAQRGAARAGARTDVTPALPRGEAPRDDVADVPLLQVEHVSRAFGNLQAVDDVGFEVREGSITALIGPNGAGKTTMFNLLSGYEGTDQGIVRFADTPIESWGADRIARRGIGRTFQVLQLFQGMTVLENVMCGRYRFAQTSLASVILRLPALVAEEQATREKALAALTLVGLSGHADADPTTLPFGLQRQVELARTLALEPRLLLMDEPASGLNDSETEQLGALILRIRAAGTTVLMVEHDMRLVMGLADHVVVMDRGTKIAEGPPDDVRSMQQVVTAYLGGRAA